MTPITGQNQVKISRKKVKDYSMKCTQANCTIEYKWKIKGRRSLKLVPFINTSGGTAVKNTGYLYLILSFILLNLSMICYKYSHLAIGLLLIFISIVLLETGTSLPSLVEYVKATKCKNCNKEYAYEEREEPDVKEASTQDSYTVIITRYWKCKRCGYIDSSESPENVKTCRGEKKEPKKIECENCGLAKIIPEYRNPDIKKEKLPGKTVTTIIRYYKCGHCGDINIKVEKETVRHEDFNVISKSIGNDPRLEW